MGPPEPRHSAQRDLEAAVHVQDGKNAAKLSKPSVDGVIRAQTAEDAAAAEGAEAPNGDGSAAVRRTDTYLSQFEEGAPFADGWREFVSSLPWTSYLFIAVAAVDVCLVLAYCIWSVNRPGGSVEESLHISLALAVTAAFFFYFVVDGIITENVFELLAAVVLDALVLARVLFYVIAKKRHEFAGRIVLLSSITTLQVFVMFLALWTVLQFGWRIFSRSAIDFRKRDAQERMRLYLSRALFLTLEKLDIQFLIIMTMVAIVIWVKNTQCGECDNPTWFVLAYNSVLFVVNALIAVAAWFVLKYPKKLRRTMWLDFPLMPFSLVQPIANICWEFKRHVDVQHAKAAMAVACGLFILGRLALWAMMHLVKRYAQVVQRLDQGVTAGIAEHDRSLLPLIRGAWLGKPSTRKPLKRRFFQLSADGTSLRWAWRKYVRLFYLTSMDVDRRELTLTLQFVTDPDLMLKFPDKAKFTAWQRGIEALVGNLMSPGAGRGGGMGGGPALARPSTSAAVGAEDQRANRKFLRHMVGIIIHDRHATNAQSGNLEAVLPAMSEVRKEGDAGEAATESPAPRHRPTMEDLSSTESEDENDTPALPFSSLTAQDKKASSFDPNKLFDFADGEILAAMAPEGGGLMRLSSVKQPAVFKLPSGVRGGGLEAVDYSELEFGKLLGAGAEGEVYAAWWRDSMVAVKRFNRAADSIHELRMHTAVGTTGDDECIIPLRGYCRRDNAVYLVMEYCPRGTLDVLIHNTSSRAWGMDKLLPMVRSTAAGVRCLHTRGRPVLHRDLKPGNIFVGQNQSLKVGDFGMSRYVDLVPPPEGGPPQLSRLTPNVIGTAQYAAPELMNEDLLEAMTPEQRYLQADVYSFGVTLWELLERKRPYKGMDPYQIQTLSIINPEELRLPPVKIPESLNATSKAAFTALAGLVTMCTATAANERPSIEEVYTIICQIEAQYKAASTG